MKVCPFALAVVLCAVRAGGASGVTAQDGRVTLRLPGRAVTAKAAKRGYTAAHRRLRARR